MEAAFGITRAWETLAKSDLQRDHPADGTRSGLGTPCLLAMIPHTLLAAHAGTIMGVETNACQYYPDASASEAHVHPYLYRRRDGMIDLSTVSGPGFGYRLNEMDRPVSQPMHQAKYP